MIPVVYGGANYSHFAPPKSYINANDFETVKDLADYLKYLTVNPKEYIKYFWWKKYYKFHSVDDPLCGVCQKLHHNSHKSKHKSYEDIYRCVVAFSSEFHL